MVSSRPEVLAVISARLNSKGMYQKCLRSLAGKPLLAYMIEAALGASLVTRVVVSTEAEEIAKVAKVYGAEVPFIRPERLAQDDVQVYPVVAHALEQLKKQEGYVPDIFLSLQPTSPLCLSSDIDGALTLFQEKQPFFLESVSPVDTHPYITVALDEEGKLAPFMKLPPRFFEGGRQSFPPVYKLNGAISICTPAYFATVPGYQYTERTFSYRMPPERSVDVNSEMDFKMAEFLLEERQRLSVPVAEMAVAL